MFQSGWWSGVWLFCCLEFICLQNKDSFVSQSGWWCPAVRLSQIHLFPLMGIYLSPSLAGGVRLSGCLQFICLPIKRFICFPVWLVVSGSLAVSNSFVFPYNDSFAGWWCPALWLSPIHLFSHITIHLSPSLAGGVRLFGYLKFIFLHSIPCRNSFGSQSGW